MASNRTIFRIAFVISLVALVLLVIMRPYTGHLFIDFWSLRARAFSTLRLVTAGVKANAGLICQPHTYTTEIVSTDPLIIYSHGFLAPAEIPHLLETAEPLFGASLLTNNNGEVRASQRRTSTTARLPVDDPVVECVLARALEVMGTMITLPHDDFQPPQAARYTAGQHLDLHADWFDVPQPRRSDSTGTGSSWNRPASFFAILEDDYTGGGTWFPHIPTPKRTAPPESSEPRVWQEYESGTTFTPVKGGALFWVNLFQNGTGDDRTRHAGLPVRSGRKTGMNIWPRAYCP